mgnify:CR=1 FL=1
MCIRDSLRGAESDADRAFVEEQAKCLGLPLRSVRVDPMAAAEGISVQMAARELRYAWFKELLREGPANMALGHHRDDSAETLVLNLMRGIGAHGWAGIPAVTELEEGRICRPLLGVGREPVSYTHLRAHETVLDLVCRLLLEKKNTSTLIHHLG